MGEKAAVEQHVARMRVQCAKLRVLVKANDVIDVRRNQITVAIAAKGCDCLEAIVKVVIVDI